MDIDNYINLLRNELDSLIDYNINNFEWDEIYDENKYYCLNSVKESKNISNNLYENKFVFNYPYAYYYVDIKFNDEIINEEKFDKIKLGNKSFYNLVLDSFYSKNKIKINNNQMIFLNNVDFNFFVSENYSINSNILIQSVKIYLPKNSHLLYQGFFYIKNKDSIKLAKIIENNHKINNHVFNYENTTKKISFNSFIIKLNQISDFDDLNKIISYLQITYLKISYNSELDYFSNYNNHNYNISWNNLKKNKLNINFFDFYKIPIIDNYCENIQIKLFNDFNEDISLSYNLKYFVVL